MHGVAAKRIFGFESSVYKCQMSCLIVAYNSCMKLYKFLKSHFLFVQEKPRLIH